MKMRVCGSWLGRAGCLIGSLVDLDVCCEVWLASLEEALPIMGAKMGLTMGLSTLTYQSARV